MRTGYIIRLLEALLLFIGLPLSFYWNLISIPKIIGLLLVTFVCLAILWNDPSYCIKHLKYRPVAIGLWKGIVYRSVLVVLALFILVFLLQPHQLFSFPRQRPFFWLIVMVLYPVLSVLPQELIYREFFFHRYRHILGSRWLMIISSAGCFAFLHIIYDNSWALILSFIGGLLFARMYHKNRSLYWVSVEHAIYGCLVFTIGMGHYFYEGF